MEKIYGQVQDLLGSADRGRILRDGLRTAIIGRPNAGKSSLMNLMLLFYHQLFSHAIKKATARP